MASLRDAFIAGALLGTWSLRNDEKHLETNNQCRDCVGSLRVDAQPTAVSAFSLHLTDTSTKIMLHDDDDVMNIVTVIRLITNMIEFLPAGDGNSNKSKDTQLLTLLIMSLMRCCDNSPMFRLFMNLT